MIRINLVKGSSAAGSGGIVFEGAGPLESTQSDVQKQGLIRVVLLCLGPILLWYYQQATLPGLINERNHLQNQINEMVDFNTKAERSVQEIKKFKEDEARIQSRIGYLDRISKNRSRDIKTLELIQQVIPEKAWLNRLEMNNGKLLIGGMAFSDFEVSGFMESLAKSVYFLDVNLMRSSEVLFDGLNLKSFEISCTVERARTNE
ncbi:MAG TPA: PilN domain-containing protein [Pseudobdellovibrionaceae bacterium]|nr:PilN domain-containing protein [Pseudobdellovibrionaceae bacterium]